MTHHGSNCMTAPIDIRTYGDVAIGGRLTRVIHINDRYKVRVVLKRAKAKRLRVLLVVDPQLTFCQPHGSLGVPGGADIMSVVNRLVASGYYDLIIISQDYHPADHGSFASQHGVAPFTMGELNGLPQMFWPDHGIAEREHAEIQMVGNVSEMRALIEKAQGESAMFHPALKIPAAAIIVRKGMVVEVDSYSACFDNGNKASDELKAKYPFLGQSTGLPELLEGVKKEVGATAIDIDVVGLASDYCVKFSAQDAHELGYNVRVIADGVRCTALTTNPKALADIRALGIKVIPSCVRLRKAYAERAVRRIRRA
jgi:nicotinamidase/pyrazinamidase